MAIAFRSSITHQIPIDDGTGDPVTVALPSGASSGDLIIGMLSGDTDTGSPQNPDYISLSFGNRLGANFFYKIIGAESTIDIGVSSSNRQALVMQAWTGVDPVDPLDDPTGGTLGLGASAADGATGLPNPPSFTTTRANSLVVAAGALDDDNATTVTAPSGYTNLSFVTAGGAAGTTSTAMLASLIKASPGAEDPGAFGAATGNDEWDAFTIAFKESAVAATGQPYIKRTGGVPFMGRNRGVWGPVMRGIFSPLKAA